MHKTLRGLLAGICLAAAGSACDGQSSPSPSTYDGSRVRRTFQPPEGEVRPVPPHAIHSQGVGPYVLGTSLKDILGLLPRGPRVLLMQIDGLLDYSLVRAEADTLLIGVEAPSGVTFLSVLDTETARTETGVGVGTTAEALHKALGPELAQPDWVMDPRLLAFARLPNTRFLLDQSGDRVGAVVVRRDEALRDPGRVVPGSHKGAGEPAQAREEDSAAQPCPANEAVMDEILAAAELGGASGDRNGPGASPVVHRGCFTAAAPEALVSAAGQVAVVGGEHGKLRRLAVHPAPDLVYAAPLDTDGDGRSEIVVVSQRSSAEERVIGLELLRFEAGRLQRAAAQDVYRVSATNAAWVGARLEDLDLLIEVRGEPEAVQVTGLYVHRGEVRPQTVAPLMKVSVPVRRGKRTGQGAPAQPGPDPLADATSHADPVEEPHEDGDEGEEEKADKDRSHAGAADAASR